MSDRFCIMCGARYGTPHLQGCVRYEPPSDVDLLRQCIAELEERNKRQHEEIKKLTKYSFGQDEEMIKKARKHADLVKVAREAVEQHDETGSVPDFVVYAIENALAALGEE